MFKSFMQTLMWGTLNQHVNGLNPVVIENESASCLFSFDKKNRLLTSFNGPVINKHITLHAFQNFLEKIYHFTHNNKIDYINLKSLFPLRQWAPWIEEELIKSGFARQEWKTLIVDLTSTQEALLKSFEHSARKGIKKAQSHGVQVERCDTFEEYFSKFLIPYFKSTNRALKEKEFYRKGWDLDSENVYNYWISKSFEGELLGFLGTFRYDGLATEIMSALTPLAFEKKIPVQDLLHWEIMNYHKDLGDTYFDLAGFNPNPISEKEKNIKRFKEKWGGEIFDISSYIFDNRSFGQKVISRIRAKLHE
ncbi:MAG: hypothetical protein B7Y25_00250 [Alphaproteobacteria bacterium 16-39-46]|nr:MAG: hypothetical protein B7Y25_00250 [Alphaproteobacteria bacterium 16-39-46]OZA44512.1 MAG: hypothetical protein B7X84_00070 [Alphaproteobacteria bacterium 17-39-52]HQS83359.1 peptidoglycan bridge formation glycyltransferase FemA/FemB family protein [Alphaproteobacteria bacterium]HQS93046.1 peptidoglycan bridge formation glycyltransferase FemA/FemB family protein [Alphaproteobacteria bacterium]